MADRIVVSLHLPVEGTAAPGYLRRALAAKKRAEVLGAALSAWSPDGFAFDFAPEEVEKAVDLALATFDDASLAEPRFSSGIAFGELARASAPGSPVMLAWGEPLLTSWRLARAGAPGEVLIDGRCPPHIWQALRTHGDHRTTAEHHGALALDTRQPFRRDTFIDSIDDDAEAKVRVTVPPLPPIQGLPRDFYDRPPASKERHGSDPPPTVRNDAPADAEPPTSPAGTVVSMAEPVVAVAAPEVTVATPGVTVAAPEVTVAAPEVTVAAPGATVAAPGATVAAPGAVVVPAAPPVTVPAHSTPPPPSVEAPSGVAPSAPELPPAPASAVSSVLPPARIPVPRGAPSVPPPSLGEALRPATIPPASAPLRPASVPPISAARISWPDSTDDHSELAAAARRALLKGNVAELERLADELRTRGDHGDLAERMAGFVAWNRGAKAEGLRKLRAAADAETRPAHRIRALLAYGVALASSGRTDAALLAGLGAIACAREVADRQGEHVCARFLARLSAAAGYERAAHTWATIAEEARTARSA